MGSGRDTFKRERQRERESRGTTLQT